MKKVLIIGGIVVLSLLIIVAGTYLYIFREQQIDVGLIPNEFSYCGKQIYGNDPNYKEIVAWLNENKDGWVASFVTYAPKQVYRTGAFQVNVLEGAVIVSYKTDYGYPQFIKVVDHKLSKECP